MSRTSGAMPPCSTPPMDVTLKLFTSPFPCTSGMILTCTL